MSAVLPSWAEELKARFQNGSAATFLLHGAIDDLQPWQEPDGPQEWLEPGPFLARFLGRSRTVVHWSPSGGLQIGEGEAELRAALDLRRKAMGQPALGALPAGAKAALVLVKAILAERSLRVAVVLEGAEALAPADSSGASELTRGQLTSLVYESHAADAVLVLATGDLDAFDPRLANSSRLARVAVPPPDFRAVRALVESLHDGEGTEVAQVAASLSGRSLREVRVALERLRRSPGASLSDGLEAAVAAAAQGPRLPGWAEELRQRYLAGESSLFLVHGNVRDLYGWETDDGTMEWVSLREFLERFLSRHKDIVAYYNVSEGLEFPMAGMEERFVRAVNRGEGVRHVPGQPLPRTPDAVLPLLESLIARAAGKASAAVVLDYVEMIVPMGDLSFMGDADKANLVALQRWSSDPAFLDSDNVVVLCTESLSDVHRRVVGSPQLAAIQVPLPDEAERLTYIQSLDLSDIRMEMDTGSLAKVTAGLTLVQIRGLFRLARQSGQEITFRTVSRRKKSIIEQECHGLVEFVDPGHDFSHVGGMERLKTDLMKVAAAIKKGHRTRVPMGIIFVGPMGTGKTFMAEAFAAESGLTCIKFKNFREKWVGSTEGNLEKILQVVDGLGYVLLILDEADRSMGSASDGDGGTSSRVIARLKEFMSDTSHRGRVVVLMMTNRPDKLDADLKRPGRFDLKIPFFFPEHPDERRLVLEALARKNKLQMDEDVDLEPVVEGTAGYSGAELESVLLAAAGHAADEDREVLSADDLAQAVDDVIPSRDTRMLEFMEMLAVFESTTRRMLPDRYRALDTEEVHQRLDQLRALLGRRV